MKWITYQQENQQKLGALLPCGDKIVPLSALGFERDFANMVDFIEKVTEEEKLNAKALWVDTNPAAIDAGSVQILSPIPRPIHDIMCVGVNYLEHQNEFKRAAEVLDPNRAAIYFGKRASKILGSGDELEYCPEIDIKLDYEVELAVIIGKEGKNIPAEKAEEYIFGYSVFNDFSARALQRKHIQWFKGKSLDGYSAMGPAIVDKSLISYLPELNVQSIVNGELRQNSNTRLMMTTISKIIEDLSSGMTLEPGDIIATGTPSGVGAGFDPPKCLKKGDTVECVIEQVGSLVTKIV